jgi:putative acetyltransferase
MKIFSASGPESLDVVRTLWREYWSFLGLPGDFQNFEAELASLPGAYSSPGGLILLAQAETDFAGAAALRPLKSKAGEVKRLYVRPKFRGKGVGRALLEGVISYAREFGYSALYADTLPSMSEAQRLYALYGFEKTTPYSANPTPGALYLSLVLTP